MRPDLIRKQRSFYLRAPKSDTPRWPGPACDWTGLLLAARVSLPSQLLTYASLVPYFRICIFGEKKSDIQLH